ncbi:pentapeptide repeat-containing protein [Aquimarina rhabdastrellae]
MEDRQYRKISDEELKEALDKNDQESELLKKNILRDRKVARIINRVMIRNKITNTDFSNILEQHGKWLNSNGEIGKQGNLSFLDLSGLDFSDLNLSKINLERAKLDFINFERTNLSGANLKETVIDNAKFIDTILINTNFEKSELINSDLSRAVLINANLKDGIFEGTNFKDADLEGVKLDGADYTIDQLYEAKNVSKKYLSSNDIEFESKHRINELQEKLKNVENVDDIKNSIKKEEEKLEKEQAAKENTNQKISNALKHLETPNQHLQYAVGIQYVLASVFLILVLIGVWNIMSYVNTNYEGFKLTLNNETTFLQWFFYVSPIILGISLVITLINQINNRLKRIIELQERKRYVGSINGALNAIHILSDNNEQSKIRINQVLDQIVENTVQLTESINKPIQLEEKEMDNITTRVIEEMTKNLKK